MVHSISRAVLAILLALVAISSIAYVAYAAPLSVSTDKANYMGGELVTITVSNAVPGRDVVVTVYNPRGDIVYVDQGPASAAGIFTTSFRLPVTATQTFPIGTYTVRAQQGSDVATTTFQFATAAAFTTVVGRVVDADTGEPIEGAIVRIIGSGGLIVARGTTDASGAFSINVDPGSYTLQVIAANYLRNTTSITVVLGTNNVGLIRLVSIERLVGAIPQLQQQIADITSQQASLAAQISNLSRSLDSLTIEFRAAQAALTAALSDISSKLDTISSDLRSGISALNTSIANIATAVGDVRTRIAVLDDLRATVTALRTDITDLRTSITNIISAQRDLSGKIDTLASRLDAVAGDLRSRIDSAAGTLSGSIGGVSSKIDNVARDLGSKIDGVSSSISSLNIPIIVAVIVALLAFVFALLTFLQVRKAMAAK